MTTKNHNYSTFACNTYSYLEQPMFFGDSLSVARYDEQKYPIFEILTDTHLGYFWRPQEISLTLDRKEFTFLSDTEKHLFISNLQYQIFLDSVQGRAPNIALLPIVSLPEIEQFIVIWSAMETVHSRSYTHIIRSIWEKPHEIFSEILDNHFIIERAKNVTDYYDKLIFISEALRTSGPGSYMYKNNCIKVDMHEAKKALYFALNAINALEAVRFHVSFACNFALNENRKMEGSGKIMRFIARDESLHCAATTNMIKIILSGNDHDSEMTEIAHTYKQAARNIFLDTVAQEKEWAQFLFSKGPIVGLNAKLLSQYIDFLAFKNLKHFGLEPDVVQESNPIPWIDSYLNSDSVQYAPQETELASYLTGQVNSDLEEDAFSKFEL